MVVPATALLIELEHRAEVELRQWQSFMVSVLGEVRNAGRYELPQGSTVFDAIVRADGFTEAASPSGVAIVRLEGARLTRILVDDDTDTSADVEPETSFLRPGDIVVVP